MAVDDIETLNYEDLSAVAHLAASERYRLIVEVRACCLPARQLSRAAWQASWGFAALFGFWCVDSLTNMILILS